MRLTEFFAIDEADVIDFQKAKMKKNVQKAMDAQKKPPGQGSGRSFSFDKPKSENGDIFSNDSQIKLKQYPELSHMFQGSEAKAFLKHIDHFVDEHIAEFGDGPDVLDPYHAVVDSWDSFLRALDTFLKSNSESEKNESVNEGPLGLNMKLSMDPKKSMQELADRFVEDLGVTMVTTNVAPHGGWKMPENFKKTVHEDVMALLQEFQDNLEN